MPEIADNVLLPPQGEGELDDVDLLDRILTQTRARMEELRRPCTVEYPRLEAALGAMGGPIEDLPELPENVVRIRHARERKRPVRVKTEMVRDWAIGRDWFTTGTVMEAFNISRPTAQKLVGKLVERNILLTEGTHAATKFRYNDKLPAGPKERPVHDRPTTRVGGAPVANTREIGPSGKPGLDKKRASQGKRVRRHRVGS